MRQGGEKMDQEKPFKTIEVVDSKTNQICKVACMSCIRGHRTTSCGIPVCRTKIFWTVKRPGRPSNSCTCRYGATGGCKCVVARSACPHKSKKGEKRSGECRCDEQGRYCCLLEPDHWTALFALQKPTVDFYSSREVLEVKQTATMPMQHFSPAPNYAMTSPSREASVPSTPGIDLHTHASQGIPATYASFSRQSSLTPRFGLMGIAAPQGPHHGTPLDPLVWDNDVPIPPRNFPPPYTDSISARGAHPSTSMPPIQHGVPQNSIIEHSFAHHEPMRDLSLPRPYNATGEVDERHNTIVPSALSPPQTSSYDFERLQADYYHYQFPSAICQNCGLSGCTCKNCPPPFQNPGTGGWTQCCGRKHGRDPAPAPVPHKVRRSSGYDGIQGIHQHAQFQQPAGGSHGPPAPQKTDGSEHTPFYVDQTYINGFTNITPTDFDAFNPEHDFVMPDGSAPLDIADYLNVDLDTVPGEDVPRGDVVRGDVPRGDLLRGAVPRREVPREDIPTEGRNGCCCKGS